VCRSDREQGSGERAGKVGPQGVQVAADEVGAERSGGVHRRAADRAGPKMTCIGWCG